ncbi:OPT family oligopeptide transporter [Sphingomonas astaxanthinifaciens]|uniref:Oligopeptide transporter, OPT family protein n=1 Tax=Sphingomonas astaxanthinifaciens DSM 22298 TaxID=1123267 RepID=A0ABQ5Z3C9_9SPHN|nr:oligopeptide transporter, OPT family [Sphingomonas astaxanthinifaciens]GLR47290.1 oligopeptide transporter, OPT family protein [Sphingomonas astaxanthinifaciens DSM 22298]
MKELTLRGIILGALLTILFTAANVYLGLKIGITFATSIPAAVISMAVLKLVRDATIQENNIVQTIASSAGTLSAIIFVLPGLIMVGWWTGFPYWLSVAVIGIGGILGVMYSVPLRRALVTGSDLPYPEGVAAAEVLKVGAGVGGAEENRRGLNAIIISSVVSAFYFMFAKTRVVAEAAEKSFRLGAGATSASASLSMALIGVGHLVGLGVGIAMIVGLLIAKVGLLPWLTADQVAGGGAIDEIVSTTFRQQVRFIGAGTIGVAAIWTLLKIIGPILKGIREALAANRARHGGETLALTERDLPITIVGGTIVVAMIPIALLLAAFAQSGPIASAEGITLTLSILYILGAGIVIASVCGYMAGLIGASNSPISGVGILSVLGIALILAALFGQGAGDGADTKALVAFALFVTAIIFGVATISNDNLQDLKTGQLVGATPWKQQVALVLGNIFGALVIPPILELLNSAFGFQGAPGAGPNALAAPQAALISAIAQGVLGGSLDWNLIGIGAGIGVAVIIVDEVLRGTTSKYSLPALAVGMGIYLPMDLTLLIPIGALLGWLYNRWAEKQSNSGFAERIGTLMATGLIVGESLMGVAYAAIVAGAERAGSENAGEVLALVEDFPWAVPLGILLFTALVLGLYAWTRGAAKGAPVQDEPLEPSEATYR